MIKCSLDTDFSEVDDRKSFVKAMSSWVKQLGYSTKETAKYAVTEQDWLPTDETINSANNTMDNNQSNISQENQTGDES